MVTSTVNITSKFVFQVTSKRFPQIGHGAEPQIFPVATRGTLFIKFITLPPSNVALCLAMMKAKFKGPFSNWMPRVRGRERDFSTYSVTRCILKRSDVCVDAQAIGASPSGYLPGTF